MMSRVLATCLSVLAVLAAAGCGSSAFTVGSASVDPAYTCPAGAANSAYEFHARVPMDNSTSGKVDVKSMDAVLVLSAVHGQWLQAVGTKYDAGSVRFAPAGVAANSKETIDVAIPSACSDPKHTGTNDNYADYSVQLTIVTSAGTFHVTSQNKHRILAP